MNILSPPPVRVPFDKNDESVLPPSEWITWISQLEQLFNKLQGTGTTSQRPNPSPFIGYMYYDTTINKPIWAKTATTWVYADGTAA